jgi:UDP-glucuronate 4-epimerase
MTVLVTGVAGFIGFHTAKALLARGEAVVGIDDLNDYYNPQLKRDRLAQLSGDFTFIRGDFSDFAALAAALDGHSFDRIVHLGAQAGVGYSLEKPHSYVRSNLAGHLNLLEIARQTKGLRHMVYASSSSVYGANAKLPFSVEDRADQPVSLYAATKRADELMSESYAHLYAIPLTGLRFFTVYGPWGRPDMAVWKFTERILRREPIQLYNHGKMRRDFTYIDDIVDGILAALDRPHHNAHHTAHRIYNIGNNRSEAARPSANSCRCSPATSPRLSPTSPRPPPISVSRRGPRSPTASRNSSTGSAATPASEPRPTASSTR